MDGEDMPNKKPVKVSPFQDQYTSITLYTILVVLRKMRRELGFEAMVEYMDFYQQLIENYNPQFKQVVGKALDLISIEKVYDDAMRNGKNQNPDVF